MKLQWQNYFDLSSYLAHLSDLQIRTLVENAESSGADNGWGTHQTIVIQNTKVFAKRIPVTKIEYDNLFSTANFYQLPAFCSYGLGSTGFGVFRELVTHLKTTHWVLQGEAVHFPLLYHYRLQPFTGTWPELSQESYQSLIESWGNNENLGRYALDRATAPYELILFSEYIPYVLESWLRDNSQQLSQILPEICVALDFLKARGIIHFDAHLGNILTDGEQIYITDFGLALDRSFALSKDERHFFEQHTNYDYGELMRNIGRMIFWSYNSCSGSNQQRIRDKYGIANDLKYHEFGPILLDNIRSIYEEDLLDLDPFYVDFVIKHRKIIALAHDFFATMWDNKSKDTIFPYLQLRHLLETTAFAKN